MSRRPLPPFTLETAIRKVRLAEDAWNGPDPARMALAHSPDSRWRSRPDFLQGRAEIESFLVQQSQRDIDCRLVKEPWALREERIAARLACEWHDADGQWFRSCGDENSAFDGGGSMHTRIASVNDLPITASERLFRWPAGRGADDHAGHSELGR